MAAVFLMVVAFAFGVMETSASCCQGYAMDSLGLQLTESSEGYVDHVYNDVAGVSL